MKAVGGLFGQVISRDTLATAAHLAAQGKRSRAEVAEFFRHFEMEVAELHRQLASGTWRFAPYRVFHVRDTKTRTIHAPPFRDRVVHHAVIAATRSVFEQGAIHHSYLRYMDDIVIWGSEQQLAQRRPHVFTAIARLKLEFKNGGEWNRCSQGLPLLGFVVYPDRLRLNHQGRKRLRKKHKQLQKAHAHQLVNDKQMQERSTALFAHAQTADDETWRRSWL